MKTGIVQFIENLRVSTDKLNNYTKRDIVVNCIQYTTNYTTFPWLGETIRLGETIIDTNNQQIKKFELLYREITAFSNK